MTLGTCTVQQFVAARSPNIIIKDNGNGEILFSGSALDVGKSAFADLPVEYTSVDTDGKLVLSVRHGAVAETTKMPPYRRVRISRDGYAVVPGDTDGQAIENAKKLSESDFDWEPVDRDMVETTATVVEVCGSNGESVEACPNAFFVTLKIPKDVMKTINGYLKAEKEDEFQPEDDTIVYTAVFPDGKQMDIKCCGGQDEASWTEAVLFCEHGAFLCCTDPDVDYEGTWELEYEGTRYVAIVQPEEN